MSEIRALLLTDVVDSTSLSQAIGDAATAALWFAHDRVARELLEPHRGREIDKTDGMLLLFETAGDALAYAHAYHAALATLPFKLEARAGLHVGPVILRENAAVDVARGAKPVEVEGLAKPIVARLAGIALGGQTLVSADALRQLGATVTKPVSHGHWLLKGVDEPYELFEIDDGRTPPRLPPDGEKSYRVVRTGDWWLPVRDIPNNLPYQTTSFIGRERELNEVRTLLRSARLVTLLGMGGLGKTRLSLQLAARVLHDHPDGTWFVDLAPISDPSLVLGETAQVLGLREVPDRPLIQTLCDHLSRQRAILILDNCEHLIHATATLASAVLRAAPHVRILASSREPLRVPGETGYALLPLPVPSRADGLAALERSTAVRLFVDRARMHRPGFELTEREAPLVSELVARLEGIPLALELAAARVRSLSIADINARLKDRYKLLTGGSRVLPQRVQTLRSLVDWSYDFLTPVEQRVFERLAAFVGGFDLASAEQVCAGEAVEADEVLDLLGALVEKSLVLLEERDDGARYRLLETIRDYAVEKLGQRADAATVAARHCEHYFVMAKTANMQLVGPSQAEWIWRIERELDNIRAAIALSLAGGVEPFIAVKFAVAMQGFWILRGYATEGRKLIGALLGAPPIAESPIARAWALYVGAALAQSQSDHAEARRMLETCLELRRTLGHPIDIAATLSTLSLPRLQAGDVAAATDGETEALEIFRRLADARGEAIGLLHLGQIHLHTGDDAAAGSSLDEALAIARRIRNQEIEGECELLLGELVLATVDRSQAALRFKRSFTVCREAGDRRGEANALHWLGRVDLDDGNLAAARTRLGDALAAFKSFEMREELLCCLEDHAALALRSGSAERASALSSAVARSRERLSLTRSPRHERRWQAHVAALAAAGVEVVTGATGDSARNAAAVLEIEDAVREALSAPVDVPTVTTAV